MDLNEAKLVIFLIREWDRYDLLVSAEELLDIRRMCDKDANFCTELAEWASTSEEELLQEIGFAMTEVHMTKSAYKRWVAGRRDQRRQAILA